MLDRYGVLYASGISEDSVENALSSTLDTFQNIQDMDRELAKPIIDSALVGVSVALKPNHEGALKERVLAVWQIRDINKNALYETFLLKATSRAFSQQLRGNKTDTEPMVYLAWLSQDKL